LALLVVAIPATSVLAAVSVEVDPDEGTIGDDLNISGTGGGGTDYDLYFSIQNAEEGDRIDDEVTTYEWLTSVIAGDITGHFSTTGLKVPAELNDGADDEAVHGGIYYIYMTRASDPTMQIQAETTFTVTGVAEITDFTPDEGIVGTEVEISGEGFSPGEAIIIEYEGDEVDIESGDDEVGSDGKFELTIIIPESTYGENTITVKGEDSLAELDVEFFVLPEININPVSGEAGITLTITGTGFDRRNGVDFYFDEVSANVVWLVESSGRTNSDGSFAVTMVVPSDMAPGNYTVLAEDEDDDDISAQRTFAVTVPPLNPNITIVSPTSGSGNVGDEVTVSGTEFSPDDTVTIYFDLATSDEPIDLSTIKTVPTGPDGSFTTKFDIPESTAGMHFIYIEDSAELWGGDFITVEPEMSMSPLTGVVNDEIDVSGTGFGADEDITIKYGTAALTQTAQITTGPEGSFSGSFLVPAIPGGSRTLTVTDGTNSLTAAFTMEASAIVNPTSGIIGSGVGAGGFGFGASKPITILVNNSPVTLLAPVTTSDSGTFSNAQFYVPATPGGTATITITDGSNSVNTSFTVLAATASITPTTGSTGTTVTVNGTNFAAGGTVTIKYYLEAGSTTGDFEEFTATAGSDGVLSTTFNVPASEGGNHRITISDGTSSINASFTIEASDVSISSETSAASPGYIGMELSVSGNGYAADVPVEVTYASDPVGLYSGTTDSGGSFTADFTIPESLAGEHTITVSVDDVEVEQFTFVMESTPPGAPALMILYLGVRAEQPVYLDWLEVTDDSSPVTYNLEIYTIEGTSEITVLEKTGLTETEYTLTEAEELEPVSKNAPYYWRVNAVDGAGNVSAWANADSFYISGGWPGWLTWLLIGLGILTVFIFALWLGRRIAFSSY